MRATVVIVGMGLLCLLSGRCVRAELYNDGGVHDITDGSYLEVTVDNPPPLAPAFTTVNFVGTSEGSRVDVFNYGQVNVDHLSLGAASAHDHSQMTIYRAVESNVYAYDDSQVRVWGKYSMTDGFTLSAFDNSTVDAHGGIFVDAYDSSRMTVADYAQASGGDNSHVTEGGGLSLRLYDYAQGDKVGGPTYSVGVEDSAQFTMSGGELRDLWVGENGQATITGGTLGGLDGVPGIWAEGNSIVNISGGSTNGHAGWAVGLGVSDDSTVNFIGFAPSSLMLGDGLSLDGNRVLGTGLISGRWLDGGEFWADIYQNDGVVRVTPIPLPGAALLGVIGLGYAGLRLRRNA